MSRLVAMEVAPSVIVPMPVRVPVTPPIIVTLRMMSVPMHAQLHAPLMSLVIPCESSTRQHTQHRPEHHSWQSKFPQHKNCLLSTLIVIDGRAPKPVSQPPAN